MNGRSGTEHNKIEFSFFSFFFFFFFCLVFLMFVYFRNFFNLFFRSLKRRGSFQGRFAWNKTFLQDLRGFNGVEGTSEDKAS